MQWTDLDVFLALEEELHVRVFLVRFEKTIFPLAGLIRLKNSEDLPLLQFDLETLAGFQLSCAVSQIGPAAICHLGGELECLAQPVCARCLLKSCSDVSVNCHAAIVGKWLPEERAILGLIFHLSGCFNVPTWRTGLWSVGSGRDEVGAGDLYAVSVC